MDFAMKIVETWLLKELLDNEERYRTSLHGYAPGEEIFAAGDPGNYMAVLLRGSVEIRRGERIISVVTPGSIFGEMGLIDNQPRMASAVATAHSRIAKIGERQFMAMLETTPLFALSIMRLLSERIRQQVDT
jgi:CRP-like cAMP-binding protein